MKTMQRQQRGQSQAKASRGAVKVMAVSSAPLRTPASTGSVRDAPGSLLRWLPTCSSSRVEEQAACPCSDAELSMVVVLESGRAPGPWLGADG